MSKKGFTLIEIMVVVALIVILVSIAVIGGSASRSVARDNQRVSDVQILQIKLESYRNEKGRYPSALSDLVTDKFIPAVPTDPQSKEYYNYSCVPANATTCFSYTLGIDFENKRKTDANYNCYNNGENVGKNCSVKSPTF